MRYKIEDITAFEKRLHELKARIKFPYEFTDYYFKPAGEAWNPLEKNLRIRDWNSPKEPTTIFFVKIEIITIGDIRFKRALYPHGKVPLFSGDINICRRLIEDLGFEPWFEIRKTNAKLWELSEHGFITAVEYIEGLGWSGELEFEGEDTTKACADIEKGLVLLEIPLKLVSFKPISVLYAEKMGLIQESAHLDNHHIDTCP